MGDHRDTAGAIDPAQGILQRGPGVFDVARLALGQPVIEHRLDVLGMALLDDVAGEMRTADQRRVAGMAQRPS
jgi:hypothetical protein